MTKGVRERAELHKTIWRVANDLRGSVEGWDFKNYVLGMLFYRFISENLTSYLNAHEQEAGNNDFRYEELDDEAAALDREAIIMEKGFYIAPSQLFCNVRAHAQKDRSDLNVVIHKVFKSIEASAMGSASERNFKGLLDDIDVNNNRLGGSVEDRCDRLLQLMNAVGDLPLGAEEGGCFKDNENDLFGDAYEYLMHMYASGAGKSGGEFYTPQEVSELLAMIAIDGKETVNKVYDPACGSGALLLKFAKVLGKENVRNGFYGQEINLTTYNLCRINMLLHDINYEDFFIAHGNTLLNPQHDNDQPFEAIVSNPPYSIRWPGDADPLLLNDPRFKDAGVLAPKAKADLAFIMHALHYLAVNGTAAIVEFPGVLYRGGAEAKIRKYLVDNNYVDAVIQLPDDMFFSTSIGTCILVIKKSKVDSNVVFIDAAKEFTRQGTKNLMTEDHQKKILDALKGRQNIPHFAKVVSNDEVGQKDYMLSVSSYVEAPDTREVINIQALNKKIEGIVARQMALRQEVGLIVADLDGESMQQIEQELV